MAAESLLASGDLRVDPVHHLVCRTTSACQAYIFGSIQAKSVDLSCAVFITLGPLEALLAHAVELRPGDAFPFRISGLGFRV